MVNAQFEHIAFNVPDMEALAAWYCNHLGMVRVRHDPGKKLFLADHTGTVVLELYTNTNEQMLDFARCGRLEMHLAFVVEEPDTAIDELTAAGATIEDRRPPDYAGDVMCFLRDPFGIPIQVLTRNVPLLQT